MQLSNVSQVLARNEDLLNSSSPLLINMPDDQLASLLLALNSNCQITFFDTNFQQHNAHNKFPNTVNVFAAQYQAQTVHDLVIMQFPKSKKELLFTLAMVAEFAADTPILIVGENKSGIKSIEKLVKGIYQNCDKIDSARHCILYQLTLNANKAAFNIEDWFHYYSLSINNIECKVAALPGVFSQEKLDIGTAVLLDNLPENINGNLLDFGCGAGVIASYLGLTSNQSKLNLADVSALALASSKKTLSLNGLSGQCFATDSLSNITGQFDIVISNPPFHQGIKTHYAATESFLEGVNKHLTKSGQLIIVANSFLKYQPIIEKQLSKVSIIAKQKGFTIYHANKSK